MKIGLALAGGGVKGAGHIGVIKALEENGIEHESDFTSSGANTYGKGWTLLREQFWYMISKIRNINANIVLVSHDAEKEEKG